MFQEEVNSLQIVAREVQKEMEEIVNFLKNFDIGKELQSVVIEIEAENERFVDQKGEGDLGEIVEDEISAFESFKIFDDGSETEMEEDRDDELDLGEIQELENQEEKVEEKRVVLANEEKPFDRRVEMKLEINDPVVFVESSAEQHEQSSIFSRERFDTDLIEQSKQVNVSFLEPDKGEEELEEIANGGIHSDTCSSWEMAASFDELLSIDEPSFEVQMLEERVEMIMEGVASIFEGHRAFDDKPKKELEQKFTSAREFLKTGSIEKFQQREVTHVLIFDPMKNCKHFHHFRNGLLGTEDLFIENLFRFYNWYKGKLVPACVYRSRKHLERKVRGVLQKNTNCYEVKKGPCKMQKFQFDRGKELNVGHKNFNFAAYLSYFKGFEVIRSKADTPIFIGERSIDASSKVVAGVEIFLEAGHRDCERENSKGRIIKVEKPDHEKRNFSERIAKLFGEIYCFQVRAQIGIKVGEKFFSIENARTTIEAVIEDYIAVSRGLAQCKFINGLLQMGKEYGAVVLINLEKYLEFVQNLMMNMAYATHTNCPGNYSRGSLVKQLTIANNSLGGDIILVLAEWNKEELESETTNFEFDLMGTSIICRSGSSLLDGFGLHVVGYGNGDCAQELLTTYYLFDPVVRSTVQFHPFGWTAVYVFLDNPGMRNLRSQHWKHFIFGEATRAAENVCKIFLLSGELRVYGEVQKRPEDEGECTGAVFKRLHSCYVGRVSFRFAFDPGGSAHFQRGLWRRMLGDCSKICEMGYYLLYLLVFYIDYHKQ